MSTQLIRQSCPYCGELLELIADVSVPDQRYVEDCQVCCRPIEVLTWIDMDDAVQMRLQRDDD